MNTDPDVRRRAIALYDRFTHDGLNRRFFMARMIALAGSVAGAEALIAGIGASARAAPLVLPDDKRLLTLNEGLVRIHGEPYSGAFIAEPVNGRTRGTVMVIHENRGLNDHIRDVARRFALAGFHAYAPDMLSPIGGTPANEDAARAAIGKLDLASSVKDAVVMLGNLSARKGGSGKVGAVGFCWGGAFVNRLAVEAGNRLAAGVVFYGPAPDPAEASKVQAPLMIHLAGLDERVNRTGYPWIEALRAAGKRVTYHGYDRVNHAFHNDTSAERYDRAAAELAWRRTLAFFRRHLR